MKFIIAAVLIVAISTANASVIGLSAGIVGPGQAGVALKGPSVKASLVGPDGSAIAAVADAGGVIAPPKPGGSIVAAVNPGVVAHTGVVAAPLIAPAVVAHAPTVVAHGPTVVAQNPALIAGPSGTISTGGAAVVTGHAAAIAPIAPVVGVSRTVVTSHVSSPAIGVGVVGAPLLGLGHGIVGHGLGHGIVGHSLGLGLGHVGHGHLW